MKIQKERRKKFWRTYREKEERDSDEEEEIAGAGSDDLDTAGCCSLATASDTQKDTEKEKETSEKEVEEEDEAKKRKDIEYPETLSLKNSSNFTGISRRLTDIPALNLSPDHPPNGDNISKITPKNYSNGEKLEILEKNDSNVTCPNPNQMTF